MTRTGQLQSGSVTSCNVNNACSEACRGLQRPAWNGAPLASLGQLTPIAGGRLVVRRLRTWVNGGTHEYAGNPTASDSSCHTGVVAVAVFLAWPASHESVPWWRSGFTAGRVNGEDGARCDDSLPARPGTRHRTTKHCIFGAVEEETEHPVRNSETGVEDEFFLSPPLRPRCQQASQPPSLCHETNRRSKGRSAHGWPRSITQQSDCPSTWPNCRYCVISEHAMLTGHYKGAAYVQRFRL